MNTIISNASTSIKASNDVVRPPAADPPLKRPADANLPAAPVYKRKPAPANLFITKKPAAGNSIKPPDGEPSGEKKESVKARLMRQMVRHHIPVPD